MLSRLTTDTTLVQSIAIGTHGELRRDNALYAHLAALQFDVGTGCCGS